MADPRSLRGYLVFPRPKDAVKWWILPIGFAIGALVRGGVTGPDVSRALVAWLVLELLIYQARYQWNDIRGFPADQRHPDAIERGRLPGPPEKRRAHVAASRAVMAGRLLVSAGIGLLLPGLDLGGTILALILAVFGVAALYEALRSAGTGSTGRVPPPVNPGILGLWLVSGAGYAIRGLAGLGLAVSLTDPPALLAAATIALWSFGVAFVTSRWALEALSFAGIDRGRLAWRASREQSREHSLALVRWLPGAEHLDSDVADWRALRGRTPALAPWNLALPIAAASAGAAGALLAGSGDAGAIAGAVAGGAVSVIVLSLEEHRLAAWLAAGVVLTVVLAASGTGRPALAALPWLAIVGAHLFFTAQSLSTLGHPLRHAFRPARPVRGLGA